MTEEPLVDLVPDKLRELLSEWAKSHIGTVEAREVAARNEYEGLRKERDEAVRIAGDMQSVLDAAIRWRKDCYSPRLQNAIDVFLRAEVSRR